MRVSISSFKKVFRESLNFKNMAVTLAMKHQETLYAMVLVTYFPSDAQKVLPQNITNPGFVLVASSVCIYRIKYNIDIMLCFGSCSGFPEFGQITQIVALNPVILFIIQNDSMVP